MKIVCEGSAFEMGVQQGEQLKENINEAFEHFFAMEVIRKLLPAREISGPIGSFAYSFLMKHLEDFDPPARERIRGISKGSGVPVDRLLFVQFFESLISSPLLTTSACTSAILSRKMVTGSSPLLIKNYDLFTDLSATTILRESRPKGRLASLELNISPLTGSHLGVNEAGFAVCYNYGMERRYFQKRVPPTILCQHALENFSRAKQFVSLIEKWGTANGSIFLVLDETGDAAVIESLGNSFSVRTPELGWLSASNGFVTPSMVKFNYKDTDVYNSFAPSCYKGMRINDTWRIRGDRIQELLSARPLFGRFTRRQLKNILRDHGSTGSPQALFADKSEDTIVTPLQEDRKATGMEKVADEIKESLLQAVGEGVVPAETQNAGNDNTICRHHQVLSTLASAIVNVQDRTMEVAFGNPCRSEYKTYTLGKD